MNSDPSDSAPQLGTEYNPEQLAIACADSMFAKDQLAQKMGIEIVSMSPGYAELRLTIKNWMLNGFASCHGGMIFSFADTAFAYACNSHNEANVAMDCRIDFLRPCFEGDQLVAIARELHRGKTSGLYDITIENQHQKPIARFSGRSFYVNQSVL